MSSCMRCFTLAPTRPYGTGGLLWLCEHCPLQQGSCGEFRHEYRGSAVPGTLVCLRCGSTLASVEISTGIVWVSQAPTYDYDC